jgi:hypothetical protein
MLEPHKCVGRCGMAGGGLGCHEQPFTLEATINIIFPVCCKRKKVAKPAVENLNKSKLN